MSSLKNTITTATNMHMILSLMFVTGFIQNCVFGELSLEDRVHKHCNRACDCETNGRNVYVTCNGISIDYVPASLPIETTHLYLRYNQFQVVTNKTFQDTNMPKLHSLDVSNSNVTVIEENAFKNTSFVELHKLFLSNNSLFDTQKLISVIESITSLEYIVIANNNGLDCKEISNYFNKSGRDLTIFCGNNNTNEPTTVETLLTLTDTELGVSNNKNISGLVTFGLDNNAPLEITTGYPIELLTDDLEVARQPKTGLASTDTNPIETIDHLTDAPSSPQHTWQPETVESTSPSTTIVASTSPSTTATVASTSPATTNTTTDPNNSDDSIMYSAWFIGGVVVVCLGLIAFCLVIGWKYYQEYRPLPTTENDAEKYG